MKSILFCLIICLHFILCSSDFFSLTSTGGLLYYLNGLDKELSVYNSECIEIKKINLKNISASGSLDFFTVDNLKRMYVTDTGRQTIYLLDGKFTVKKEIDVQAVHNIRINKKIFATSYNSILIASEKKNKIYRLENNRIIEIISLDFGFIDFFYFDGNIYVLEENKITVFNTEGIRISVIAFSGTDKPIEIISDGNDIFLNYGEKIGSVHSGGIPKTVIEGESIRSFALMNNSVYYLIRNSLKVKVLK